MYQVGVAIRARNLDKARLAVLPVRQRKGGPNQKLKKSGDAAAHSAMVGRPMLLKSGES